MEVIFSKAKLNDKDNDEVGVNSRVAPCFNFLRGKQVIRRMWFCGVQSDMLGSLSLLFWNRNLAYGTTLGTPAEFFLLWIKCY